MVTGREGGRWASFAECQWAQMRSLGAGWAGGQRAWHMQQNARFPSPAAAAIPKKNPGHIPDLPLDISAARGGGAASLQATVPPNSARRLRHSAPCLALLRTNNSQLLRAVFARTWHLHTTTANEKNGHPHHPPTGLIGQPFTASSGGRS